MGLGGVVLQVLYHIIRALCHGFQTFAQQFNGKLLNSLQGQILNVFVVDQVRRTFGSYITPQLVSNSNRMLDLQRSNLKF